ncbi:hypothetical protein ACIBCA_03775 [Kitasatospora sp. NPDC051170]|uniref:hypothetical protein n=1 Tax=Kitasatospora sp. NPDC051170 TaxID=3364056 RepID=UPI00378DC75F
MSNTQQIRWTVLPAGVSADGTQALVSVFVSPRLTSDDGDTLGPFPDFLDWPAHLALATFGFVVVKDGEPVGEPISPTGMTSGPDSALWTRFFTAQTPLQAHVFEDHSTREVASYPSAGVTQSVRAGFTGAAAAQTDTLPNASAVAEMAGFAPQAASTGEAMESLTEAGASGQAPGPMDQFFRFHTRPGTQTGQEGIVAGGAPAPPPPPTPPPPPPPPPTPSDRDFHELISALGDHPHLLRRLGLVLDFTLPADQLTLSEGDFALKAVPVWSVAASSDSQDLSLSTAYVHRTAPPLFTAASGEGGLEDPLRPPARGVMLLDPEYSLEQVDVDGAALKAANAAAAATADSGGDDLGGGDSQAAPPTVRTKGLVIVHNDRAAKLQETFARNAALEQGVTSDDTQVLAAEDLVRGYRMDVFDEGLKRWLSLHERIVDYHAPGKDGEPIDTVTDEGFFQHGLTTMPDGDPNQLYAHEHLITWEGNSLAASPHGLVVSDIRAADDPNGRECPPIEVDNTAQTALPLEIDVQAKPGSLPKLRFGHHYRVRVRTVDLAGNGPTIDQGDALSDRVGQVLPPAGAETFRRFEPVPAPMLVPRAALDEGAHAYQLVIRSTKELSATDYATAFNASPPVTGGTHKPYAGTDERHVVPAKTALRCVLWHGKLDAAFPSDDAAVRRAAYEVACRESGKLDQSGVPGIEFVVAPGSDLLTDDNPVTYPICTLDQLAVPYLPDPYATGVIFQDLPGLAEGDHLPDLTWDGPTWYQPRSLRLRVVEGGGAPQWDAGARVLTVQLPKAAVATVRVRSKIEATPDILGMLQWCRDALSGDGYQTVLDAAGGDGHWMMTPWHEVTLVHAVQRPLAVPVLRFDESGPEREPGATSEQLRGSVTLDTASTGRIDLFSQWTEQVDDLQQPGPQTVRFGGPVFDFTRDYAVERSNEDPAPATAQEDGFTFDTAAGELLTPPVPAKHEFHNTRYRAVDYHVVATTAFSSYFPPEFAQDPSQQLLSVSGEPVRREVLSSARPAPPALLYGIPTIAFAAVDGTPAGTTTRRRSGGLRIYLDRPWYSSGDGEMLGVVIPQDTTAPGAPDYLSVTLLGRDPIHVSAPVPTPAAFTNAAQVLTDVPMTDVGPDYKASLALFQPAYDPETRRWFCDLDLDTGDAYQPFVRLALVRYQPKAIDGAHLSPVVLTDLLRTLPERVLTVQGTGPLNITLTGPSYPPDAGGGPRVTARLERRETSVPDEVLGWTPLADEVELARSDAGDVPIVLVPGTMSTAVFGGAVPVPARPDGERRRLLVVETERIPADAGTNGETVDRVVYCDTVEI